jgi:excinuclease ABC subunit A
MATARKRSNTASNGNGSPTAAAERRTQLSVRGARVHNLKNIDVDLPRDALVVLTGLSGSGKSSLAFDTIYAEGQRRFMESLSSFARRFVTHLAKPDVDFMYGLSPVISIEQKTVGKNPRSTVGTLTDVASYWNLLFATIGQAHCPYSGIELPRRTHGQLVDLCMKLPRGSEIELTAPVWPPYGEELSVLFTDIRKKGYRHLYIDDCLVDLQDEIAVDESAEHRYRVLIDRFKIDPTVERQLTTAIQNALLIGDRSIGISLVFAKKKEQQAFWEELGNPKHGLVFADIGGDFFMFNDPSSACVTCGGLGVDKLVHPKLLVPDPSRSIRGGCFVKDAYRFNTDTWDGWLMYSLAKHRGFSLDTPYSRLAPNAIDVVLNGTPGGERFKLEEPPEAKGGPKHHLGEMHGWTGIARRIERSYRRYRQQQVASSGMEAWLEKVMVEVECPECHGTRLKRTRELITINGRTPFQVGQTNFDELRPWLSSIHPAGRNKAVGEQILHEIVARVDLLLGIGLDYLNFNRKSGTLSGGESQRIRLSTQIGSGLMGMLYVLDEPSIGLHPKDNAKMIAMLRRLRDLGNTVIVVEHDEDTIRAADHIIEMGPGPGVHGGQVVVQGSIEQICSSKDSTTGAYLSGRRTVQIPLRRRPALGKQLVIRGARENNLKSIDVTLPLGQLVCISGASGSGKSTLVNEILFKALYAELIDSRMIPGAHDVIEGLSNVQKVVNIDQSPIGRSSRSNPATYLGFYDDIRALFAAQPESQKRKYTAGRFSFNVKGGRCPECEGEGSITNQLSFMGDVETLCPACKGARFNPETLEITYRGKSIAEVLDLTIEDAVAFFGDNKSILLRVRVLNELGLGYLTLGQSSNTLSGGEAQRIKLAGELSRLTRSGHTLYILDEPTTGLHLADIQRLLDCLHRLVDAGHSVVVIEHHLDVIKTVDHIIDLGPEGGHAGGTVVVTGTPEDVAHCRHSHTGRYLKAHLERAAPSKRPVASTPTAGKARRTSRV